mgnify:CR=1 FL=1
MVEGSWRGIVWKPDVAAHGREVDLGAASNQTQAHEPMERARNSVFTYAPDHLANYCYAMVAGELANVFKENGLSGLEATYTASAELAFTKAEALEGTANRVWM